jgi:hypothetical protein
MAGAALILPVSEALGQLKWSWFQQNSKQMWDFEIFDNASRGPWGSLLLLLRTKGKALAALGAMITICMMALDPFFQQVVNFPERWALEKDLTSKIPKTAIYDPRVSLEYYGGFEYAQDDPDIFHVMEKYAYGNGTQPVPYGNGTRPDIPLVSLTYSVQYTALSSYLVSFRVLSPLSSTILTLNSVLPD